MKKNDFSHSAEESPQHFQSQEQYQRREINTVVLQWNGLAQAVQHRFGRRIQKFYNGVVGIRIHPGDNDSKDDDERVQVNDGTDQTAYCSKHICAFSFF